MLNNRDIKKYANDYASNELSFEEIMVKYRRKKVLEFLEKYRAKNILEIGCGMDSICNYYNNFEHFTIVEPSEKFLQNAVRDKKNVTCVQGFLEDKTNELSQNCYDFIILSSLLHEVENPNVLLDSVRKLCSKDTIIHINVPNSNSFHLLWAYKSGLISSLGGLTDTSKLLQQNNTYNIQSLENTLSNRGGVAMLDKGSYFIKPFNHKKMSQACEQELIDDMLLDGLYSLTEFMPELGAEIYINYKIL